MPKKCGVCETVKDFSQFKKDGRKWANDCNECVNAEQLGLNPVPDMIKKSDFDAARAERQRQYKNAIAQMTKPLE